MSSFGLVARIEDALERVCDRDLSVIETRMDLQDCKHVLKALLDRINISLYRTPAKRPTSWA